MLENAGKMCTVWIGCEVDAQWPTSSIGKDERKAKVYDRCGSTSRMNGACKMTLTRKLATAQATERSAELGRLPDRQSGLP